MGVIGRALVRRASLLLVLSLVAGLGLIGLAVYTFIGREDITALDPAGFMATRSRVWCVTASDRQWRG